MKNLSLFTVAAFLLLVFAGCQKDQLGPLGEVDPFNDITSPRESVVMPFHATYTTFPEFVSIDEAGTMVFNIPGEGDATLLGKSMWFSVSNIYATFQEAPWVQNGTSVFVSERGDSLVGVFNGTTAPTKYSPFVGSGKFWIRYGTGDLKGYTGNGTYDYTVSLDTSKAQLYFRGILIKPKTIKPCYPERLTF